MKPRSVFMLLQAGSLIVLILILAFSLLDAIALAETVGDHLVGKVAGSTLSDVKQAAHDFRGISFWISILFVGATFLLATMGSWSLPKPQVN